MPYVDKHGRVQHGSAGSSRPGLTSQQRTALGIVGVLVLPSLGLRAFQAWRREEKVDLTSFAVSAQPFDTPAIEKVDGTLRIEFCMSWQVKGQFARVAGELRSASPDVPLAAAAYVPPKPVQAAVKVVRVGQVLALTTYFFGAQFLPPTPRVRGLLASAHEHRFPLGLGLYVTHLACELAYSTSAFEITYNGQLLFSKLREGRFPQPGEIGAKLQAIVAAEKGVLTPIMDVGGAAAAGEPAIAA